MQSTTDPATSNGRSLSTTWEWRKIMMRGGPPPAGDRVPAGHSAQFRWTRSRRYRGTFQIQYRGGPEGSFVIWSREKAWRFPGHMSLIDVASRMAEL